jgi:predicted DNA-binding transcriptional regulator YafY
MKWGVEQRLSFIEARLCWEGHINRKDLISRFGISIPQASSDLRKYQELAPDNIKYDKSGKFYYASKNFKPKLISPNTDDYFAQLHLIAHGVIQKNDSFLSAVPEFDIAPHPERSVEIDTLQKVIKAIKDRRALEIEYQSMSIPDPSLRWITPHAFGYDGFRWHVRAFCHNEKIFKDFILGRIIAVLREKFHEIDTADDILWQQYIMIKIAPHPKLSDSQKEIIERDYGMENGIAQINLRASFVYYLIKRLGLVEGHEKNSLTNNI